MNIMVSNSTLNDERNVRTKNSKQHSIVGVNIDHDISFGGGKGNGKNSENLKHKLLTMLTRTKSRLRNERGYYAKLKADEEDSIDLKEVEDIASKSKLSIQQKELFSEIEIPRETTLASLSLKYSVPVAEIKRINNILSDEEIYALSKIKIPLKVPHSYLEELLQFEREIKAEEDGIRSVNAVNSSDSQSRQIERRSSERDFTSIISDVDKTIEDAKDSLLESSHLKCEAHDVLTTSVGDTSSNSSEDNLRRKYFMMFCLSSIVLLAIILILFLSYYETNVIDNEVIDVSDYDLNRLKLGNSSSSVSSTLKS